MQKINDIDLKNEAIRCALAAIAESNNGYLDVVKVLHSAKNPDSILHDEFEWDDERASEQYRIAQAGALIRRVRFTVVKQDSETKQISITTARAYQSRESKRHGETKGYESVQEIMADPIKRDELIMQVLKELNAYRKRYKELVGLGGVWCAIDDALEVYEIPSGHGKAVQAAGGLEDVRRFNEGRVFTLKRFTEAYLECPATERVALPPATQQASELTRATAKLLAFPGIGRQ